MPRPTAGMAPFRLDPSEENRYFGVALYCAYAPERLAAPEQARSCNLVRGSGILGGKNGALGAELRNGMANGKLEALLAEWRQKRLLILGLGVSNRPWPGCCWKPGAGLRAATGRTGRSWTGRSWTWRSRDWSSGWERGIWRIWRRMWCFAPGDASGKSGPGGAAPPGAAVTSEMEIFFQVCPCPVIAVTGSDGKTTTTTLLAEMLRAAGKTVWVGEHWQAPFAGGWGAWPPSDWAVVELSSFQLMDMDRSGHIAVVTNLAPNHLDVHKDMAEYVEAKEHVFCLPE